MKKFKGFFKSFICCACLLGLAPLRLPAPSSGTLGAPSSGTYKAETLTYREVEGEITVIHTITITHAPPGYRIELASQRTVGGTVRQTFRTAADLSTLAWSFSDPGRQMELDARMQGEAVILSGSLRGRPLANEFKTGDLAWNQLFQIGMEPIVISGETEFKFCSIGTEGPGELKMGKFTATRENEEMIQLGGKETAAVHLRVSLSGLLSIFWHGDYWYRKSDGRFLRFRGKNRPSGPVAVLELIAERPDEAR